MRESPARGRPGPTPHSLEPLSTARRRKSSQAVSVGWVSDADGEAALHAPHIGARTIQDRWLLMNRRCFLGERRLARGR